MITSTLDDADIESAQEIMRRAGVLPIVLDGLGDRFTLAEFLSHLQTPPALRRARHAIWKRSYDVRTASGAREYSTSELGRYFNRDHSTMLSGIKKAT